MMFALIQPTIVQQIDHWQDGAPIMVNIPNSARVCQVEEAAFDVASPLIWVECSNSVAPDVHYYNTSTNTFHAITNAEQP